MIYIFDFEVMTYNWILVAKPVGGEHLVFCNDNEAVQEFLERDKPLLGGFNNKSYDNHILKGVIANFAPREIKQINDYIIAGGNGWDCPLLKGVFAKFDSFDLMDDMQAGLSLKSIEAHLGMDIRECSVPFDIDRPLTDDELEEVIAYCKADVDATEKLFHLRKSYLENKIYIGSLKGIPAEKALYMTNAKLTAAYLDAVRKDHDDEREYVYPDNIQWGWIPSGVKEFFDRIFDKTVSDEELFSSKFDFCIDDCECTVGFGGIHGAIPHYREKATETRTIRNVDVGSYYPHQIVYEGYASRNIPDPGVYAKMLEERMAAKRVGDKAKANALKLICNTTYGACLNAYNDLYDPLMGRSICITGQLRLLELAGHLAMQCPTLVVIQINTDGVMVSLDITDLEKYTYICAEWQERTHYALEEDIIDEIIQKDVNGYLEIGTDGSTKIKGGYLVRGISTAGAFNINNNATIIPKAIIAYFKDGVPVEETIGNCTDPLEFQLIAKASGKYSSVYHKQEGYRVPAQRCNRVYASKQHLLGTLYKVHKETGAEAKIADLPEHCVIDNSNQLTIDSIDKDWYIQKAKRMIDDFLGIEPKKVNKRRINKLVKEALAILEGV